MGVGGEGGGGIKGEHFSCHLTELRAVKVEVAVLGPIPL